MDDNGSSQINMKKNLLWRKRSLIFNEKQLQLFASTALHPELKELSNPIQCFLYICFRIEFFKTFPMKQIFIFVKKIQTNIHFNSVDPRAFNAFQKMTNTCPKILENLLKQSNVPFIHSTTTIIICQHSIKIRPLLDELNNTFSKVPKEQFLCVDEQICSSTARCHLKRYNPNKPHKWGFKIYVLSGISGFCYKFAKDSGKKKCSTP